MVISLDTRGAGEGAAVSGGGQAERRVKRSGKEVSDDETSQSNDAWEHMETVELTGSEVVQTLAATVLDGSGAEHMKWRAVRIPPAKLEGERSCRNAHASATRAYLRDHNHELTPPCPLAQAVGRTPARRLGTFRLRASAGRSPSP